MVRGFLGFEDEFGFLGDFQFFLGRFLMNCREEVEGDIHTKGIAPI